MYNGNKEYTSPNIEIKSTQQIETDFDFSHKSSYCEDFLCIKDYYIIERERCFQNLIKRLKATNNTNETEFNNIKKQEYPKSEINEIKSNNESNDNLETNKSTKTNSTKATENSTEKTSKIDDDLIFPMEL